MSETVAQFGEFSLIERIKTLVPQSENPNILIDMGDDTAVIRLDANRALLLTCDIQIEDRHFRLNNISPNQLGHRAMAVNLSDIAAMGGKPTFGLVSLGLPSDFPLASYDELFKGMGDELRKYNAAIVGGNLARTEEQLIIDITLLGDIDPKKVLTRNGAKEGDRIFVTGELGASGAGFYVLEKYGSDYPEEFEHLVKSHRLPTPRIAVGQYLAKSGFVTSMIDLSDGVASDLYHICTQSGVGAEIRQEDLPFPENIEKIQAFSNMSSIQLALHNGEDYELLFTTKPDAPENFTETIKDRFSVQVTEIGQILPKSQGFYLKNIQKKQIAIEPSGWDHFGKMEP